MANYTEHYQLHQWEPEDPFLRTDFNEDLKKIDTALEQQKFSPVLGSYTGDGVKDRTIELGFRPRILVISGYWGAPDYCYGVMTCFLENFWHTLRSDASYAGASHIKLTETGFQLISDYHNVSGQTEHYFALA